MKIIKLKAENIKKLKAVEITPTDNMVKITGKNGAGKSSVLDSILYALQGKSAIPVQPIRQGEDKGEITLDLGDFIVTRTFTKTDNYLKVVSKDGATYGKAQDKLNKLINGISFDPLAFSRLSVKEQKETLLKLLKIDIGDLESEYSLIFEQRSEVGTFGKAAKGELDSITKPGVGKVERISVTEVAARSTALRSELQGAASIRADILQAETDIKHYQDSLAEVQTELIELKKVQLRDESVISQELNEVNTKLEQVEEINKKADTLDRYNEAIAKVEKYRNQYKEMTDKLNGIKAQKADRLAKSEMPVKGLGVSEDGVTFNDIPYSQLSTSEQIKVGMAIAISSNPELRVIRIMDGSLLDSDAMKAIADLCKETDTQVWCEFVGDGDGSGFVIEDGELKGGK